MCGIVGLADRVHCLDDEALCAAIVAMRDRLAHRGPDDAGLIFDSGARLGLAHRRLSIVDLSDAGSQPMVSSCGRYVLTYNGEIYNCEELRSAVPRVHWRGHSDTEAVLEYLAVRGPAGIADLNGMFAFALYDRRDRELILARDRFGQKPLYYTGGPGWFTFASELSALRTIPWFDRSIDRDALAVYLLLQYVHQPRTIHRDALKLPPGSWLRIQLGETIRIGQPECYFEWKPIHRADPLRNDRPVEELIDELEDLLDQSVRRRLMSDVPLGVLLSGGVDSALIASSMVRVTGEPVQSFSIGFEGSSESEHTHAREAAAHIGTAHCDDILQPEVIELLPTVVAALDEPLGDSSCLPTWLLARLARQNVKVVLTGDGGDELFGGYQRYAETLREQVSLAHRLRYVASRRRRWSPADAYCSPRFWMFMPDDIEGWLGEMPPFACETGESMRRALRGEARPLIDRMRELDARTYLPGAVLAKVDRMTMAHGLEARNPFLDPSVAAFAARLPAVLSADARQLKPALRRLVARRLPPAWATRPKRGFGLPAAAWSHAIMLQLCDSLLLSGDARICEVLDRSAVARWVDMQRRPAAFSVFQTWTLLVLELWLRRVWSESGTARSASRSRAPSPVVV